MHLTIKKIDSVIQFFVILSGLSFWHIYVDVSYLNTDEKRNSHKNTHYKSSMYVFLHVCVCGCGVCSATCVCVSVSGIRPLQTELLEADLHCSTVATKHWGNGSSC